MADIETYSDVTDIVPNLGGKLVRVSFEKANTGDVIILPDYLGTSVVWCNIVDDTDMTPDDPAAVDGLKVTLSTGTGARTGLFLVE